MQFEEINSASPVFSLWLMVLQLSHTKVTYSFALYPKSFQRLTQPLK